jgi:hypothetical protein
MSRMRAALFGTLRVAMRRFVFGDRPWAETRHARSQRWGDIGARRAEMTPISALWASVTTA